MQFRFMDPQFGEILLNSTMLNAILASGTLGNTWFVNETIGVDGTQGPNNAQNPFKTLDQAQSVAVPNNNDVVFLLGSSHRTSTLAWAKDGVSLVGLAAPSNNCRARISSSGTTPFSPLVNVTAQNCKFVNLGTFHGGFTTPTGSQVCWLDAAGRNYFYRVQFLGGGDAVAAALAGMRSLTVSGSGESLFEECTIGLDTILRATNANASLEFLAGTARNVLRRCIFQSLCSDVSDVHVKVGPDGIDRYVLLDECLFINAVDSTGASLSAAISADAAAGGSVIVKGGACVGAGAIALSGPVYVSGAVPVATTSSIAVKAT